DVRGGAARERARGARGAHGREPARRDGAGAERMDAQGSGAGGGGRERERDDASEERTKSEMGRDEGAGMTATPAAAGKRCGARAIAQLKERLKHIAHGVLGPVVGGLAAMGLKADQVTWIGMVLGVAAGVAFFFGRSRTAAALLALSGVCDILDGELARRSG